MKAVVLAAGRGTRMKSLTNDVPKPMIPVGGRPLLEHVVERLQEAGVTDLLLVIGYRAETIEQHFRDHPMRIAFRRQAVINGTGSAALLARDFIGEDRFLLTFGDILASPTDYAGLARLLTDDPQAQAVVGVKWVEDPYQGAAVYEEGGILTDIIEKPLMGSSRTHWNSAGLYAFRPSVFPALAALTPSPRGEYELTSALCTLLETGYRLRTYPLHDAWRDVGRPEDLRIAEEMVEEKQ